MKTHTNNYKNQIKEFGREIDSKITYIIDGTTTTLGKEQLNSVTPHYESSILKSVMKQLDVDSNVEIPLGTVINYKFGLLVNGSYEYVDYGNYIVYEIEKQEDTRSWRITCYDKMLYAMKPYESLSITYPITIKNYLQAISTKLGLTLGSNDFVNANKQIINELYLDADGNSLDYTYRDVLDELAGVTASIICINENDELEVRYPQNVGEYETQEGTSLSIENVDDGSDLVFDLNGNTAQNGTPTPSSPIPVETVTGRQDMFVANNQLLPSEWAQGMISTSDGITISANNYWVYTPEFVDIHNLENITISFKETCKAVVFFYNQNKQKVYQAQGFTTNPYNTYYPQTNDYYYLRIGYNLNGTAEATTPTTIYNHEPMINKGTTALSYEKGNTYEINLGKNLFDKDNANIFNGYITSSNIAYTNGVRSLYIQCKPNTTYTVSKIQSSRFVIATTNTIPANNVSIIDRVGNNSATSLTITTSSNANYLCVFYYHSSYDTSITEQQILNSMQIEESPYATSYSPYKTPIELCKIGNYQDFIRKGTGKNLINPDDINFETNNVKPFYNNGIVLKSGHTYTMSGKQNFSALYIRKKSDNSSLKTSYGVSRQTYTPSEDVVVYLDYYLANINQSLTNFQFEEGNQATEYEPYGYKDKWYLYKTTAKKSLNGSNNDDTWYTHTNTTNNIHTYYNFVGNNLKSRTHIAYSNYFYFVSGCWSVADKAEGQFSPEVNGAIYYNSSIDNITDFKTWLSTHNTIVYYVLATPTATEITDTELINQLESVKLLQGLNNVAITSDNLSTPIKMTYLKYFDTIDEEYLKDVNVNFGEKYGPVNSVVLSRSAESDNIYRKDDESVEENGLTEVKIKDNQILNGNNRDEFIDDIFNKLKGLEYYINDYVSTGISYLELGDIYKVQIENNSYKCLMLNDELDVTQGLQEPIHTERMEDSETDYTKADKTDRKINQAYIIVDKQNQQINSVVQTVNTLQTTVNSQGQQISTLGTSITQTISNITANVTSIQEELDNGVSLVKTTSVTIDDSGLNVSTDNSRISTTMSNNSFEIKDSGDNTLAFFGYDETENTSKSQMDNLTVTTYLTAGNHRIESFERDGEARTGYFYIG